ncbi:MAG TPA: metal-dependent hydrolase [Steroidobacteraceae bacterium]|jgi:inner membrane protein|nr:metal-dependent hydrolase [Steroidobacteraceae bacterium]
MDNVTHTLIGALLGETVARTTQPDPRGLPGEVRRNLLVATAAIGSNLPDVDLLYSFIGGKINYLLQHRGYSHTIIGALVLAASAFAIARWGLKRRGHSPSPHDVRSLAGVFAFTPLLHIGMDFTNNYGVHPFWPISNRWLYGDAVFIAEPFLWAACAPLALTFRTLLARAMVVAVLAIGIGLALFSGLVPRVPAVALIVVIGAMLLLAWRVAPQKALAAGVALWLAVTATFVVSSQVAACRIATIAATLFPGERSIDRVLTPMPANPLCWEVMLVQTQSQSVIARRTMLALAPSLIPADGCLSRSLDLPSTAPLERVHATDTAELHWYGEIATDLDRLRSRVRTDCEAAAAMRFIRVPWMAAVGPTTVLGDLRYDREKGLGFAEIELHDPPLRCPRQVPHWRPPRADLLR